MSTEIEYIFSINTGRSGSHYLMHLFNHAKACQAFHEPEPRGNGSVMRAYAQGNTALMKQCVEEKLQRIHEIKRDCHIYAETSHCFIKGFGWFLPQHLPQEKIGVVILRRIPAKIVESYTRVHCSPLNPLGRRWISLPNMKEPLVPPPNIFFSAKASYSYARCVRFRELTIQGIKFLLKRILNKKSPLLTYDEKKHLAWYTETQYPNWLKKYEQDCLNWYIEETEKKTELFRQQYPAIKYYEVTLEGLNSLDTVQQMFACFGLRGKDSLASVLGKPTNLKS